MLPSDIGAAAAYEVWRNWKQHYGVYGQPLAGDRERQQEALVGLAVGEGEPIRKRNTSRSSYILQLSGLDAIVNSILGNNTVTDLFSEHSCLIILNIVFYDGASSRHSGFCPSIHQNLV